MTKRLTIDNLGLDPSIEWAKNQEKLEQRYITEFPVVSKKAEQAIIEPYKANELDQLLGIKRNPTWAAFAPFKGYLFHLKTLFRRKLMPHIDVSDASDALDEFFDDREEGEDAESNKLYELFEEIKELDGILDEIYLNILSCLKS